MWLQYPSSHYDLYVQYDVLKWKVNEFKNCVQGIVRVPGSVRILARNLFLLLTIIFNFFRHIKVDNMLNLGKIKTFRSNICRHQYILFITLERSYREFTFFLSCRDTW